MSHQQRLEVEDVDHCPLCGSSGVGVHRDVPDRLFGTAGTWTFQRCRVCAALWLDPRPLDSELHKAYLRYFTHEEADQERRHRRSALHEAELGYARRRFGSREAVQEGSRFWRAVVASWPGRRADAIYLAAHLEVRPGGKLLDVGCGDGELLEHLQRLGWNGTGVEPDGEAAAVAQRRGLDVHASTLEERAFPDHSFDAVVLSHVIEHLPNPAATLNEVRRVLVPGGSIVIMTPNAGSALRRVFGSRWIHLDPPRHLVIHSQQSLSALLRRCGFSAAFEPSWRAANVTIAAAWSFARGATYDLTQPPTFPVRLASEIGQLALAAVTPVVRWATDELVAIGTRDVD